MKKNKYKDGVYYCPKYDRIYLLTNILHDDDKYNSPFVTVDYESESGAINGIWIYKWSFGNVIYLGKL